MPIRPENKSRYPDNWKQIRTDILTRAQNRCEFCGIQNHAHGYREQDGTWRQAKPGQWDIYHDSIRQQRGAVEARRRAGIIKIVLTVAHLDHTPENNDQNNLKALCQRCHNRYDREHRSSNVKKTLAARSQQQELPL